MDENEKGFIFAAEYAYEDDDGEQRIIVVKFPASDETLEALTDKIGECGYYRDGPFPHYGEGSIAGLDEVFNEMEGDISPEDLNDVAAGIARLDEMSQGVLRDAVDWRRYNDEENLRFMVDALSEVTRRGVELSAARAEIVALRADRVVEGYKVIQSVEIDGQEIIVGENPNAEYGKRYLLWHRSLNADFGQESHMLPVYDADYLVVMKQFAEYITSGVGSLNLDRVYRGNRLIDPMLTEEWCLAGSMDMNFEGKVIALKPEILSPEYRAESHQLFLATGGFGCSPTAMGKAVFCTNLYDGERATFRRHDVLGVMDETTLPEWAREKLAAIRRDMERKPEREVPPAPASSSEAKAERGAAEHSAAQHGATGREGAADRNAGKQAAEPPQFESVIKKIEDGKRRQRERPRIPKRRQRNKRKQKVESER